MCCISPGGEVVGWVGVLVGLRGGGRENGERREGEGFTRYRTAEVTMELKAVVLAR